MFCMPRSRAAVCSRIEKGIQGPDYHILWVSGRAIKIPPAVEAAEESRVVLRVHCHPYLGTTHPSTLPPRRATLHARSRRAVVRQCSLGRAPREEGAQARRIEIESSAE